MRLAILIGAVLLGSAGAAVPAAAQRNGYDDRYDRQDRGWRDDRGWRNGRGHGWDRHQNRGWGRDRSRIVCRTYRSYYGPERRCFRIHR